MKIWKYRLALTDRQIVHMPLSAKALCVQVQEGEPQLWALLDDTLTASARVFTMYGTGHDLPPNPGNYVGTFQLSGGRSVFHVFDQMGDA